MNHIVIGALLPYLVGAGAYLRAGRRAGLRLLIVTPLLMAAGAIWAAIPDSPRVVGAPALYRRLHADPRSDIFFFHYTIDAIERESILYTVAFVLMVGSLLVAAWRELRERECGR